MRRRIKYVVALLLTVNLTANSIFLNDLRVSASSFPSTIETLSTTSSACSINDLYTDLSMYNPGSTATITAEIGNTSDAAVQQTVYTTIYHLETEVFRTSGTVTIPSNGIQNYQVQWTCPSTDYMGYMVQVTLANGDSRVTAIDVSSDISRYPRYGYTVDFPVGETSAESVELLTELSRDYHINVVQYYDWMYRHEKDLPSTTATSWVDMFGNEILKSSITNRVTAGHALNMKAMAYQMAYMAREDYEDYGVKKEWGIFRNKDYNVSYNKNDSTTISNIDQLYFPLEGNPSPILFAFNPENKDWQNFMATQYKESINTLGFDGIQIDQMGSFWGDIDTYDYNGNYVDLGITFSGFVDAIKEQLTANNSNKDLVTMNVVNGAAYPKDSFSSWDIIKNADTDFQFSEIWQNCNNYNDLKNYIDWQRSNDNSKTMVVAAYMNQYDNNGTTYQGESGNFTGVTSGTEQGVTYVTGFDNTGDSVNMTVQAPESGTYSLVFLYANGTVNRASKAIYVDGTRVMTAYFDATRTGLIPAAPSWYQYSYEAAFTAPKTLYLSEGTHTITIKQDSDCTGDIRLDSLTFGTFDSSSVRLTNAALAASGAMHIEMGTGLSTANSTTDYSNPVMLGHPYYPKAFKSMTNELTEAMKVHYNFITAYENLLYDPDLVVSDGGLQSISIIGESLSGSGEAGKIWFIAKNKGEDYGVLNLINLTGENDTVWRNATGDPVSKSNLIVRYYIPEYKSVESVSFASPDLNGGITNSLAFTEGTNNGSKYIEFTLPSLEYWDLIYIKYGNEAQNNLIEAEDTILSGVGTGTDHAGYTGSSFVDEYGDLYDSVTFDVSVPADAYYSLKFKYANATGKECSRELIVDNASKGKVTFVNLTNWDTWGTAEKGVYLTKGIHRMVLLVTAGYNGFINLDHIKYETLKETARSLYMNNWKNTTYIWKDSKVNNTQSLLSDGPSIYELRFYNETESGNYNTNQIKNYSMFFRNESDNMVYTTGANFNADGYFGDDGILYTDYKSYNGQELSPTITKAYAVIPEQNFMVVKYTVKNNTTSTKTYSILDMLHVNNTGTANISASYNTTNKTSIINMSASGQYYIAHGTLEGTIDGYQVADDTVSNIATSTCSPWVTFNSNGTLKNNTSVSAKDISTGFVKRVTLAANASQDIYFYLAISHTSSGMNTAISAVRAQSGSYWMNSMKTTYQNWLEDGLQTNLAEDKLNDTYNQILIGIKQSIVPGRYVNSSGNRVVKFASMPATTNPSAYSYKVWARDSAVTAMSLDASGHYEEAEEYWLWLADRQIKSNLGDWKQPGAFWTCYWIWDNSSVSFVEPEYDSIGMFLVGAYRHYKNLSGTAKEEFLNKIWDAYKLSADVVVNGITTAGFGAADCSIWEESTEYNAFTQGLYSAGLDAAQEMAKAKGLQDLSDWYNGGAGTIRSAIQRSTSDGAKGLFNDSNSSARYYTRAINTDGTVRTTVDSSSDVLMTYGVVDMMSKRAYDHYQKITSTIQHDEYGVARYEGDTFYTGKNSWDPGGIEAFEDEPSWPQMSMWVAMMEIYSGYHSLRENALRRMEWYADRTATGYVAAGECVSNITLKPMTSTMMEPITGAAYIMTALAYEGSFDMRNTPYQYNAGAYATIDVNGGCMDSSVSYNTVSDFGQWSYIPYYLDETQDYINAENGNGDSTRDIAKVYICNDETNIYIRIDNVAKSLPGYNEANNLFNIAVYSQDFKETTSNGSNVTLNNTPLEHTMNYAFVRRSDSDNFTKYKVSNGTWIQDSNLTSCISPQWDTNSGRIELVIPRSELTSSGTAANDWANMTIVLGTNTGSGFTDADRINIHYRITASGTAWIFGNSEN